MKTKINLNGINYWVVDTREKITIADSFVVRQNKIGSGNGEAKLYVGNDNKELRQFFGGDGFAIHCFLLKKDLLKYLEETRVEYLNPEQPYINKGNLPTLWKDRKEAIEKLPEIINFKVIEQTQIKGTRIYINSSDVAYNLIRELSLPNITYISVIKLINQKEEPFYYFRLFADYFGEVYHPYVIRREQNKIDVNESNIVERVQLYRARVGQGEYRKRLLEICPICPITLVSDDRLLIASHIKPWVDSDNNEKIDPKNGFMFTPTYDFLFDRGYISFNNDQSIIISPWLSNMTISKLNISPGKKYLLLPIKGREIYLDYHRKNIFKQ